MALKDISTRVWHWFFPGKILPPECLVDLLRFVYPTIDWSRVSFYDGWPHVIGLSSARAITLPGSYTLRGVNIYFKRGHWDPFTCDGLSVIVHEGFHVLQIRDVMEGRGLGLARPFVVQYLACWASNGFRYNSHSMEEVAYDVAGRARSLFDTRCKGTDLAQLAEVLAGGGRLVQRSSGIRFWRDVAEAAPKGHVLRRAGSPVYVIYALYVLVWVSAWCLATLALSLLKICIELLGTVLCGVLWLITWLVCGLAWTWLRGTALLSSVVKREPAMPTGRTHPPRADRARSTGNLGIMP